MAQTFKQLQDEVLNYGFDETYRPRVKVWLNEAVQRISRGILLPSNVEVSSVSTVAGTANVALPTNFVRLIGVLNTTTTFPLQAEPILQVQQYQQNRSAAPLVYAVDASNTSLLLYPSPDAVYNLAIRYYASPDDMSTDEALPSIPAAYQDLLVTYALSRAFRAEDDFDAATYYTNQFAQDMQKASTDLQYQDLAMRQVPGTWWS